MPAPSAKLLALRKVRRYAVSIMYDPTPAKIEEVRQVVAEYQLTPGEVVNDETTERLLAVYSKTVEYLAKPSGETRQQLGDLIGDWVRGKYE